MARAKTEKKLISFVNGNLVNNLIRDKSELNNCSDSAIVEQILLDSMLPKNKDVRKIIINHLYSEAECDNVKITLYFIFKRCRRTHNELEQLVQFARNQSLSAPKFDALSSEEQEFFRSSIASVVHELKENAKSTIEYFFVSRGETLLFELEKYPQKFGAFDVYDLLLDGWNIWKRLTIVYDLLAELVKLGQWNNDCETRVELLETIKIMSAECNEEKLFYAESS